MKVFLRVSSFAVGLSLFLCSTGVRAQELPKPADTATMWDEYGTIGGCNHSARLDNLAIMMQNNSSLEGYLVYYGPESESERTLEIIQNYLTNSRGVGEERWKRIYAGPNTDPLEPRIQLWLSPHGAPPPELVKYESKVETFNGLFFEHKRWDGIYFGGEDGGTGPPVPGVAMPTFIEMLKKRKETLAYIVAFSGTESAPGAWRRVAQLESEDLQSGGVPSDRIKTIYAGPDKASKETRIQLWILPKNQPPPVADAGPELPPTETRKIGEFGDYELGDERGERWAFKVLLDGFRASEELRVCIIVRLEAEGVAEEEMVLEPAQQETPLLPDLMDTTDEIPEAQQADFLKLVDKWKSELTDKHKIRPDRVIVLFATPREDYGQRLETWIVPSGALLPDPDAEPPEEASEEPEPVEGVTDKGGVQPEKLKSDKVRPDKAQPDKNHPS